MKFGSIPSPVRISILLIFSLLTYNTVGTFWIGVAFFAMGITAIMIHKWW